MAFSERGQFFTPDLIVAAGVFVFSLTIFFTVSASVSSQQALVEKNSDAGIVIHNVTESLLLSGGSPNNWDSLSLSDTNSIGLAVSSNVLDSNKVRALAIFFNSADTYLVGKKILGTGPFDIYLRLLDAQGSAVTIDGTQISSGVVASNAKIKLSSRRLVWVSGGAAFLEVTISGE